MASSRKGNGGKSQIYEEFNLFDGYGNQELHVFRRRKNRLGGGWVAIFKKPVRKLIQECDKLSTFRVYMYLATKQTYQKVVMVTQIKIAEVLKMAPQTVSEAIKWLRERKYIQVHKIDGNTGFLLNPKVTLCGVSTKASKEELWNLQLQKENAQLEEDLTKRQQLVAILDELIQKNIYEGEENEYDELEPEERDLSLVEGEFGGVDDVKRE